MKRIHLKTKVFQITVLLVLTGCTTSAYYHPQVVDIPLIKEKGDIRLNAGYFMSPSFHGGSNSGAHATFSIGLSNMVASQTYAG